VRVLVTGGRDFRQEWVVFNALAKVYSEMPEDEWLWVIHGGASGVDTAAAEWAWSWHSRSFHVYWEEHKAKWSAPCRDTCKPGHRRRRKNGTSYCPAAGNYRNQEMVDSGADLCLVFPGGTGTADCRRRAEDAGIPVEDILP
jgi:predicted Rossmann-fold nucleotide-binding protein